MNSYRAIVEASSRWIDRVATTIVEGRESLRSRRLYRLVEQRDGAFLLQGTSQKEALDWALEPVRIVGGHIDASVSANLAEILRGAQVELVLQPDRFMFRLLELPRRASDFLEGIIRAQIDRLTPWSAADAAFGWYPSTETANDRLTVTIAATARTLIAPFISAIASLGADTIVISAALQQPRPDIAAIKICEQKTAQAAGQRRVRRILIGLLVGAGALGAVSVAASSVIGGMIEAQRDDLTRRLAERHAAIQPGHDGTSEKTLELQRHKHETPSSVIVIEALSRVLPDDTYLTELRILGDKMQIVGVTRDAPSLIRLIEQTSHFSHATFFAPTTRSPSESGERFSIEAHIEPVYTPGL
ncbi:MAG: PilN domain-containing protein [Methylocella sp.]